MHVYSPACVAVTESIVNCFVRLPVSLTVTSCSVESKGSLLNIQVISKGASPFITEQVNDVASPAFKGSSPKENVPICGATEKKEKITYRLEFRVQCDYVM